MEQDVTLPVAGPAGTVSPVVEGIVGTGGATRQVVSAADYPVTPRALLADAIVTGGTAIVVATGPINGGWVTNPASSTDQGISAAENAYLDMVGTPVLVGNGTTETLYPGQNFTLPALAAGVDVMLNAATAGHSFSGEVW